MHVLALLLILAQDEPPPPKPPPAPPPSEKPEEKAPPPKETLPRLYKLVAKQEKGEIFRTCDVRVLKTVKYGGTSGIGSAAVAFRSEKSEAAERALLYDEAEARPVGGGSVSIKTLIKEKTSTLFYPADNFAFVYDLSKDGNTPWQWILYNGINAGLEARYKISVIRDPEEKPIAERPKEGEPKTGADSSGMGLVPGVRSNKMGAVDIFAVNKYILDLEPRGARQKAQTLSFTVWIDPATGRIDAIMYEDAAEALKIDFTNWKVHEDLPKETFELDLSRAKVKNR